MGSPKETATIGEIEQQIRDFSDEDILRLERFARYQVFRCPSINPREVIGEAVVRLLSGRRNWPRDVPFKVFFCNVMRSVADDFRADALSNLSSSNDDAETSESGHRDITNHDSIDQVAARKLLAAIWKLFDNDEEVQMLIQGIEDGMTAKEVQANFGLTDSQYGAARKRLERTLYKQYPNGLDL